MRFLCIIALCYIFVSVVLQYTTPCKQKKPFININNIIISKKFIENIQLVPCNNFDDILRCIDIHLASGHVISLTFTKSNDTVDALNTIYKQLNL